MGTLGPDGHKVCFSPLRVSGGHGFYSKCNFTSPTLLLGQHRAATTPALHYKEQYCIGFCKDRSRNQGKLEVVKQEMARVNIDILNIMNRNQRTKMDWNGLI